MAPIRLGTASPATQASTAKTLGLISDIAQRAASKNIDILLLPEAFIGGYPRGSAFGCVIGDRSAAGRDEFADYFDAAVDLGDTVGNGAGAGDKWVKKELAEHDDQVRGDGTREELERISRETDVFIVTGLIEKAGGSLYCAVVYVCPKNGIIGKRRKVMPTGTERLVWAQGCPSTLRAVSTTIRGTRVNLAAAICWESYMPLLRQALYSQNINLYLAPTADGRDGWLSLMRTIGVEGRCFVLSSNMCVRDGGGQQANSDATPRKGRTPSAVSADTDGCEIILPPPHSKSPSSRRRRKSVFDDDGNEIVLCSPADNGDDAIEEPKMTAVPEQATIPDARPPNKGTFVSLGGSCIVNPFGDAIAGPQWEDDQGLIYADVDLRDCIRGRLDLDAGGSYSRNDSFNFSVKGLNLDPLPY